MTSKPPARALSTCYRGSKNLIKKLGIFQLNAYLHSAMQLSLQGLGAIRKFLVMGDLLKTVNVILNKNQLVFGAVYSLVLCDSIQTKK